MTTDVEILKNLVAQHRADGFKPACVIATAGTVNTGAIDDLQSIADFCQKEDMSFHVDGCIGALVRDETAHLATLQNELNNPSVCIKCTPQIST